MKFQRIVVWIAGIAALAFGGWWLYHHFARPSGPVMTAVLAKEGPIEETVDATGSIAPMNRVEIKPPIGGRIENLLVDEGAHVKAGQILAWMSSSDRAAILDAARAQGPKIYKHWEDAYKPTPILAPLSGVVILRNVVVGQTVDASTVLYAMSDYLIALAQVDESDIGRVHVGMPARNVLDAYPDRADTGKVFDILYEGKNVSNVIQYGVKIKFEKVPDYYRSQMTANVSFIVRKKDNAVLIPSVAIRQSASGAKEVMVPGPDNKPVFKEIKTGIENGDYVEVTEGLKAGDTILRKQGKYVPQQGPQASPLTMGGRPPSSSGGGGGGGARPRSN